MKPRQNTDPISSPNALLIKYKESQQEDDPVLNYEVCQQLDNKRLNSQALYYKALWHWTCEDLATLRKEKQHYHELYLDAKDESARLRIEKDRYHQLYLDSNR